MTVCLFVVLMNKHADVKPFFKKRIPILTKEKILSHQRYTTLNYSLNDFNANKSLHSKHTNK